MQLSFFVLLFSTHGMQKATGTAARPMAPKLSAARNCSFLSVPGGKAGLVPGRWFVV